MPKRFTETQKWDDPWFRALSPDAKLLWFWIVDKCDSAGIIEPDFALCEFQTGIKKAIEKLPELESRIGTLNNGKLIVIKFVEFQQGKLSHDCKAHKPIFDSLKRNGMIDENGEIKGCSKGIHTLWKGYPYPTGKGKEIGKGNSKEEVQEEDLPFDSADFATFWQNWNQHLTEKKKPLKPTARKQQLAKLKEMGETRAIAALKHSMANNWQGIFEPNHSQARNQPSTHQTRGGYRECQEETPMIPEL